MYDYNNGRFLSVDPFIQNPESTQSLNPYTYIFNNPLSGTDPTGYLAECDDNNICDLSGIKVEELESISINEDNSVTVNTTDGKSFNVESITSTFNGIQTTLTFNENGTGKIGLEISEIGSDRSTKIQFDAFGTKNSPSLARQGGSIVADSIPIVGAGKSAIQVVTGEDLITGESVSRLEEAGGIILGIFGAKALSKGDDAVAFTKMAKRLADPAYQASRRMFTQRMIKLKKQIIYQNRSLSENKIISGGLAGAIRAGVVKGTDHIQKGKDSVNFFKREIRQIKRSHSMLPEHKEKLIQFMEKQRDDLADALLSIQK